MKRILFYDDAPLFGGHEHTVVELIKYLARHTDLDLGFIFDKQNKRLYDCLSRIETKGGVLNLCPMSFGQCRLQFLARTVLSFLRINKVKNLLNSFRPDIVIAVQGNIDISIPCVIISKRCNYPTVSFIPFAHKFCYVEGAKISAVIKDFINAYFYKLPDMFITTSYAARDMLVSNGVVNRIAVVYGFINPEELKRKNRSDSRKKYGMSNHEYIIALVGRVVFIQKAHDFLIETISKYRGLLKDIKFVIVGDGPDGELLRKTVENKQLDDFVSFVPWEDDMSDVYSAIDMLIIPSRYEGLPLVMLEAIYYGLPVVASNIDGMAEVLPKEWLFQCEDSWSFIKTVLYVKENDNSDLTARNKLRVINDFNVENFGENFYQALIGFSGG